MATMEMRRQNLTNPELADLARDLSVLAARGQGKIKIGMASRALASILDTLATPPGWRLKRGESMRANGPMGESPAITADEASFFLPADADTGILADFIAEANEHLESSDLHLMTLENEPGNRELLDAVFRAFHSIKGVAGFLGLDGIKILSHEAENLLDRIRNGERVPPRPGDGMRVRRRGLSQREHRRPGQRRHRRGRSPLPRKLGQAPGPHPRPVGRKTSGVRIRVDPGPHPRRNRGNRRPGQARGHHGRRRRSGPRIPGRSP